GQPVALHPHGLQEPGHGLGPLGPGALPDLRARPTRALAAPVAGARAEHVLGVLRVRDRAHRLGAALVLRRADRRDRSDRDGGVRPVPALAVRPPGGAAPLRRGPETRRRSARGTRRTPVLRAHCGPGGDAGRERLLPDDAVLLLLRAGAG